ncbi:MAG: glycosyltransferase family 9 protein [Cytophagales bacterium]|nr:glycosyltransferase family 9 protein [Bernardetiaceae bacterium]MDW8204422.1 glycosyltransferase family 9 protein [Cytophagales bacterium]
MKIAISRTDNIGDVILSLPMAGLVKREIPNAKIIWIGKAYTRDIVAACQHVDAFYELDEWESQAKGMQLDAIVHVFPNRQVAKVAAQLHIPLRIGTSHRWYHWLYCNRLVHLGRRNSPLHEAQLNIKLLKPLLGKDWLIPLHEIVDLYGFRAPEIFIEGLPEQPFVILHPKSRGSAREWAAENYLQLAQILEKQKLSYIITGTAAEGAAIQQACPALLTHANGYDFTGKLTLAQLITLINKSVGLVACSTGPLHIAAALSKPTVGIYPPVRPIHPGRWAPVGKRAEALVINRNCRACTANVCACIASITPQMVWQALQRQMAT